MTNMWEKFFKRSAEVLDSSEIAVKYLLIGDTK
jgi:hypothetical protein